MDLNLIVLYINDNLTYNYFHIDEFHKMDGLHLINITISLNIGVSSGITKVPFMHIVSGWLTTLHLMQFFVFVYSGYN